MVPIAEQVCGMLAVASSRLTLTVVPVACLA